MDLQRTFIIGDSWLYYKVYCGVRSSDKILLEVIKPLVAKLTEKNIINQWFFIRYNDPDYHLRIRFHLNDTTLIDKLINLFNRAITPYLEQHFIYKIQVDTYNREIERYGITSMLFSEHVFNNQSNTILTLIEKKENDNQFFLEVIFYIDDLLNNFELFVDQKLNLALQNATSFKTEFEVDKKTNTQLYKKHEALKTQFNDLLKNSIKTNIEALTPIHQIKNLDFSKLPRGKHTRHSVGNKFSVRGKPRDIKPFGGANNNSLLSSYIHMFANRAFRSKQRFYELVCYDFLTRHYKTIKYSK